MVDVSSVVSNLTPLLGPRLDRADRCTSMATWSLMLCTCWVLVVLLRSAVADNQAVGRPTWQSSNLSSDHGPRKAVDGNTSGELRTVQSCTHTMVREPAPQWWMVNLQRDVRISSVVLYNRADCCSDRLKQFHLELHQNNPQLFGNITMVTSIYQDTALPAGPTTFTFDPARTARWVQVFMTGVQPVLTLCEVQVFGEPLAKAGNAVPTAGPCGNCQASPVVLPQLPPLTTHASLSVGNASPTDCASLCLHHGQCLGFYFHPVVGGPPTCTLVVSRPPGAPVESGLPGPVTYFEMTC